MVWLIRIWIIHQVTRVQVVHTTYCFLLFSFFSYLLLKVIRLLSCILSEDHNLTLGYPFQSQPFWSINIADVTSCENVTDIQSWYRTYRYIYIFLYIYLFWVQGSIMNVGLRDIFDMDRFSISSNILFAQGTKSSYFLFPKMWAHMRYPCYMVTIRSYISA